MLDNTTYVCNIFSGKQIGGVLKWGWKAPEVVLGIFLWFGVCALIGIRGGGGCGGGSGSAGRWGERPNQGWLCGFSR